MERLFAVNRPRWKAASTAASHPTNSGADRELGLAWHRDRCSGTIPFGLMSH